MTKDMMFDLLLKAYGGIGMLAVAILCGAYTLWRLVKKEGDSDVLFKYYKELADTSQKKALDHEAEAKELRAELEAVSKERNQHASEKGELIATNQYYIRKIEEMQSQIRSLEGMVSELLISQGVLLNEIKELREEKK